MLRGLLMLTISIGFTACGDDRCATGDLRCDGADILVCDETATWVKDEELSCDPAACRCVQVGGGLPTLGTGAYCICNPGPGNPVP